VVEVPVVVVESVVEVASTVVLMQFR